MQKFFSRVIADEGYKINTIFFQALFPHRYLLQFVITRTTLTYCVKLNNKIAAVLSLLQRSSLNNSGVGKPNITDHFCPEDLEELKNLLNELFGHETESYQDFKKAIDRWPTK